MVINIISEDEYKETAWYRETLCGIDKKTTALRYGKHFLNPDDLTENTENVIIIGTSPERVSPILKKAIGLGLHPTVVSCHPSEIRTDASYVLIDHDSATKECMEYFAKCGRKRTALYGINKNSYADMIKTNHFAKKDIYIMEQGGIKECFEKFYANLKSYDSVICSNYLSAVYLMKILQTHGVKIPSDLYVASYGDSVLGSKFSPSLTTITLNHEQLGVQAINLCRFHAANDEKMSVTVRIPCEIHAMKSTEFMPFDKPKSSDKQCEFSDDVFKSDKDLAHLQSLEKMLRACDEADFEIINSLLCKNSYAKTAEMLFMSENSVKYRIKRLLSAIGEKDAKKMLETYKYYIGGYHE